MRTLVLLTALCSFVVAAYSLVAVIKQDLEHYVSESECVDSKIVLGIERRDIATSGGTCWVRESALDKPLN